MEEEINPEGLLHRFRRGRAGGWEVGRRRRRCLYCAREARPCTRIGALRAPFSTCLFRTLSSRERHKQKLQPHLRSHEECEGAPDPRIEADRPAGEHTLGFLACCAGALSALCSPHGLAASGKALASRAYLNMQHASHIPAVVVSRPPHGETASSRSCCVPPRRWRACGDERRRPINAAPHCALHAALPPAGPAHHPPR